MQGGSVSWKGGILEMRGEIGNARRSWSGGNVETRGKFRVKENWREKLKKIKIKVREEFAEGFGEGERKSGIKWKYAKEERKKYLREGINARGVSFVLSVSNSWVLLERLEELGAEARTRAKWRVSSEIKESEAVRETSSFKLEQTRANL